VILDTNALSAFFEGIPSVAALLAKADQVAMPVMVMGEYRFGLRGSRLRRELEAKLDAFARTVEVLPVRETTTFYYADIRHELKKAGTPIPENDVWIAALAKERALPVLSQDAHFDLVKGIKRVAW
jgi:tRNA(fMet)-specific endonuclease VapC